MKKVNRERITEIAGTIGFTLIRNNLDGSYAIDKEEDCYDLTPLLMEFYERATKHARMDALIEAKDICSKAAKTNEGEAAKCYTSILKLERQMYDEF